MSQIDQVFSRNKAKNTFSVKFRFQKNNRIEFDFEKICSKTDQFFEIFRNNTIKFVPKVVAIYAFFLGKFENFGNFTSVQHMTNSTSASMAGLSSIHQRPAVANIELCQEEPFSAFFGPRLIVVCWFIKASAYIHFLKRNL